MNGRRLAVTGIVAVLFSGITAASWGADDLLAASDVSPEIATAALPDNPPARIQAGTLRTIRAATFEVVMKKPEQDPLGYEKALPLELLPFAQRTDRYQSVGTAFAIAPDTFVTAAHVTTPYAGSQWGTPLLRDAQGRLYPFERVTRFSLHEDFIVFTVTGAPAVTPLPASTAFQFDTPVVAVGNALGEGIVAREGILTSETPEDEDGRWKWLRFSAPASPGNSGGPLLDANGNVIGLIARKSANENLNFALPIGRVLQASQTQATIDRRHTVRLPFIASVEVTKFTASFPLPLPFEHFSQQLAGIVTLHTTNMRRQFLARRAADLYPRGNATRLLADLPPSNNPLLVTQQADGSWDVPRNLRVASTTFGNEGSVAVSTQGGATLFRIRYPADQNLQALRGQGRTLAEHLLKGMRMARLVGSEQVRITSFGDSTAATTTTDTQGRVWQQFRYTLPFSDSTYHVYALPMPDGYVGIGRLARGMAADDTAAEMRLLLDFVQVAHVGTLAQWQRFLAEDALRPAVFAHWKTSLDPAGTVVVETPRVAISVDPRVLDLTDRSLLMVQTGPLRDGDQIAWDVIGVQANLEAGRSAVLSVIRRPKPESAAGQNLLTRWGNMVQARGAYTATPQRDPQSFWVRRAMPPAGVAAAEARVLYDVAYSTPTVTVEGEVRRAAEKLPTMVQVRESQMAR